MRIERMHQYLTSTEIVDWHNPTVSRKAIELAEGLSGPAAIAKSCFEFVRDEIKHSGDHQMNPVTCTASEVLTYSTGYCYSKSHLLAALLRANRIPAGICYQRLTISDGRPPFCLHALNGIYLGKMGWYRVDARGDTTEVHTSFIPPVEKLAFSIEIPGEADLPEIWPEPLHQVVRVLRSSKTFKEVADNLPDVELLGSILLSGKRK